jgi:hypothetical protein
MKHKNTDLTAKILLSVVGVILVGAIVYYTMNFFNSTKAAADNIVDGTADLAEDYADYDIKKYDGEEVRGSEIVNLMKKYLGDYTSSETAPIYVQVDTVNSGTTYSSKYINNAHISDVKNFSFIEFYIKPTAKFNCKVIKTTNKAIVGISFKQK